MKPDQFRLTALLTDTVSLLCKNGLNFQTTLRIEGVLGITVDDSDVFIVHLNENISNSSQADDTVDGVTESDDSLSEEKQTLACSKRDSRKSYGVGSSSHSVASTSSKLEEKPTVTNKEMPVLELVVDGVSCNSSDINIHVKEENLDDDSGDDEIIFTGSKDNDNRKDPFQKNINTAEMVERGGEMSFRRHGERHQKSVAHCSGDQYNVSGQVSNAEVKTETQEGDCNLDSLVLSSLPSNTDGEFPRWSGQMWSRGSYGADCLPVDADDMQSQHLALSSHSLARKRSLPAGLRYPEMHRRVGGAAMLKPFACPVAGCNRRFFHRNNVYRHRKQKHGENVVELGSMSMMH